MRSVTRLNGSLLVMCLMAGGAPALAQDQEMPKGMSQLLRAMQQGLQSNGAAGAASPGAAAAGGLDTPQNVQTVVAGARERRRNAISGSGPEDACNGAAGPLRPARLAGSGWPELVAKCVAVLNEDQRSADQAREEQERRRVEIERTKQAAATGEAQGYESRRQALLRGLAAGRVPPANCSQWMVARGLERSTLQANDVSRIAYRPPQGLGYFDAALHQIQGDNFLVRAGDHLAVVAMDKRTKTFRESEISERSTIGVVGQQSGTRTLKRPDGSTLTVAVVTPTCVVGAPNHLLDLMPESGK